jgi:hypothetical protein
VSDCATLGHVTPVAPSRDCTDCAGCYAKSASNLNMRCAGCQLFANQHDGFCSEDGPAVALARASRLPVFAHLIGDVIGVGSLEQMRRVATRRIVAPVQDMQRYHVRVNVSAQCESNTLGWVVAALHAEPAVSLRQPGAEKRPTLIARASAYLCPETIGNRWSLPRSGVATGFALRIDAESAAGVAAKKLKRCRLLFPTLCTSLRNRYLRLVHWVTSSEPVPGDVSRAGTLVLRVA